jgi:hypothetical protein
MAGDRGRGWRDRIRRHYRWLPVGAGVMSLCLLPALLGARPAPRLSVDAVQLRDMILASAARPYQGYADSSTGIHLPDLPDFADLGGLLDDTGARVWHASPEAWRVTVLQRTGERGFYRRDRATYLWDFERNLLARVDDEHPVRLPWAVDMLPPDLARRLLRGADSRDPVTPIGARRVAGVAAAGLRLAPSDPDSTVGRVDIWADPRTGLPVQVEVGARGAGRTVLTSRFLELRQEAPDAGVLTLPDATVTTATDLVEFINEVAFAPLPDRLAGRVRSSTADLVGVGAYGTGLSTFIAVPLPGRLGFRTMRAMSDAGALPVEPPPDAPGTEAYQMSAGLLTMLVVRTAGDRWSRETYLLAGFVRTELLRRAAADLLAQTGPT